MNEKLNDALQEISDRHIDEAASPKKRKKFYWFGAIAAVLAVVILWNVFAGPMVITAKAVSVANYDNHQKQNYAQIQNYAASLGEFFGAGMKQILSGSGGENQAYSPINLYMALAVTAELSGGDGQILQALGASDLQALRTQANAIWNVCYKDGNNPTLLANSLWLDSDLSYVQSTMDTLAENYFTSVYQGDFGSAATNYAISAWLNGQTGGLLKDSADSIDLNPETVFALYSTIYYQAKWQDEFSASKNTNAVFHAPGGDITCTYMNKDLIQTFYYWGEDFGAVALSLKDGSKMWLILPDEDKTADDVLDSSDLYQTLFGIDYENNQYMKVNLSLPKFDIRAGGNLMEDLKAMGITDVFDPYSADFSAAVTNSSGNVFLEAVNQATRVAIDEKGVTAASYIEIPGAGSAAPPEEIIDFVLDRPFLFVVTNHYGIPLFAGTVNEP